MLNDGIERNERVIINSQRARKKEKKNEFRLGSFDDITWSKKNTKDCSLNKRHQRRSWSSRSGFLSSLGFILLHKLEEAQAN